MDFTTVSSQNNRNQNNQNNQNENKDLNQNSIMEIILNIGTNKLLTYIMSFFIVIYMIYGKNSDKMIRILNNSFIKIVIIFLIIYLSDKNISMSIILLIFLLTNMFVFQSNLFKRETIALMELIDMKNKKKNNNSKYENIVENQNHDTNKTNDNGKNIDKTDSKEIE
jgi:hypothetical protein